MDYFIAYDEVAKVVAKGSTRATVQLKSGIQVDLRVVPPKSYGAALHYFTGSKSHNIAVRKLGQARGLKINEYGIFRDGKANRRADGGGSLLCRRTAFIEPELREDRGEIQAAFAGQLPKLISLEDIRGDLHVHTKASDGKSSLREMVEAARAQGYQYVAITDHTKHATVARGLDEEIGQAARRDREAERRVR